jgi:hypothetical protein
VRVGCAGPKAALASGLAGLCGCWLGRATKQAAGPGRATKQAAGPGREVGGRPWKRNRRGGGGLWLMG